MFSAIAAKAISLLWVGTILSSVVALLTQIALARVLGPSSFGSFFSALISINLVAPFVAFGIPTFWLKVFGQEHDKAVRWLKPSYKIFVVSSVLSMSALCIWSLLGKHDESTKHLIMVLSPLVAAQGASLMLSAKFQLENRNLALAIWENVTNLLRFVFVSLLIFFNYQLFTQLAVAYVYCFTAIITLLYAMHRLTSAQINLSLSIPKTAHNFSIDRKATSGNVLKGSWKFGLGALLYLIYYQIDVLMLKYISGPAEAGIYSAAYLVVGATYTVPGVIFQKYLVPKLHRWQFTNPEHLVSVLKYGTLLMGAVGILAAITTAIYANYGMVRTFGFAYEPAISSLCILSLAIPFRFASTCAASVMVSEILLKKKIYVMSFAVLINVTLNFLFIPRYGAHGAAWSTVATEAFMFLLVLIVATRKRRHEKSE